MGSLIAIDSDGDGVANSFSSPYVVIVQADLDGNGSYETQLFNTDLEGALGFGFSPLGAPTTGTPHMLIELEVPLLISPQESWPFRNGTSGPEGTGYSPDPQFWGGSAANDLVDPPITANFISIDPLNGNTHINSNALPKHGAVSEMLDAFRYPIFLSVPSLAINYGPDCD